MSDARLLKMYATCESGLEEALASELTELGGLEIETGLRGVAFGGTHEVMWRANVCSRVANRILVQLAQFRVRGQDDLYEGTSRVDWTRVLSADQTLAVDTTGGTASADRGRIIARELANQVVKDAICDQLRRKTGSRPSVDRQDADVPLNLMLRGERATLSLDASGARLHRRGYRTEAGPAPLKETVAAGILRLAGWTGETSLLDPVCGAGTIAIEAALLARAIPPGLERLEPGGLGFAFQRWVTHEAEAFEVLMGPIRDAILPSASAAIVASDIEPGVLGKARRNAERAGVAEDIDFRQGDAALAEPVAETGILIGNPPYGERIG
ncbi:MAG: 23S rRNA G2445 N2-methylase RlmL, partial [Myxococcota bacterium]